MVRRGLWSIVVAACSSEPAPATVAVHVEPARAPAARPREPAPFTLTPLGPVVASVATKEDGVWHAVVDPGSPDAPTALLTTTLHPDGRRPWSVLHVVAADLRQLELHLARARVPERRHRALVMAFNGGPKEGGMHVDGVTVAPPLPDGCAVVARREERYRIEPSDGGALAAPDVAWWRQTPACLVTAGAVVPITTWTTVVRRSAIGLARDVLFVGMGENVTAQALAAGMRHAGALDVAPLDVGFSFPRAVVFERDAARLPIAKPLFEGFGVTEGQYVAVRSNRDFFYLARKL